MCEADFASGRGMDRESIPASLVSRDPPARSPTALLFRMDLTNDMVSRVCIRCSPLPSSDIAWLWTVVLDCIVLDLSLPNTSVIDAHKHAYKSQQHVYFEHINACCNTMTRRPNLPSQVQRQLLFSAISTAGPAGTPAGAPAGTSTGSSTGRIASSAFSSFNLLIGLVVAV